MAIAEYERALDLRPGQRQWRSQLGYVNAMMSRTERAREILEELEQEGGALPELYVALGETETALQQMERIYNARNGGLLFLRCTLWSGLDLTREPDLRDYPRFQDVLRRVNSPE